TMHILYDAEGRAERMVDVAGDDHQRLAGGDQDQDGGVQEQVLDALLGQERAVAGLGDADHHQEDQQDGEFAHLEDAVDEAGGAGGGTSTAGVRSGAATLMRLPSPWLRPSRFPRWRRGGGSRR